jgi:predicted phage terminase large subunit-like protein
MMNLEQLQKEVSRLKLKVPSPSKVRSVRDAREADRVKNEIGRYGRLSLRSFIQYGWHVVEPMRPYVHGWAIDAIAEHLEAVSDGEITRLLINVPPGMSKSLTTAVFWPAWEWGPQAMPNLRFIGFSYDTALSTRDALRCRRLMMSEWYQGLWGDRFKLLDDQNMKMRYENDQTGFRISDYVGGGTGDRGDRDIVDDPHNVKDGESDLKRNAALLWLRETLPTRLNDPDRSAIVVIHHRIHTQDMAGEILASDLGYQHLCLPMEFESDRVCTTSIGFKDPRTEEGELLFPERFPREVIERDKKAMGSYAWAGQMQQRPSPRGGGMFKRDWFDIVDAVPADCYWVRRWDLASTEGGGAYTAGVLMGYSRSSKMFYIGDVVRGQIDGDGVKRLIRQTAALDVLKYGKRYYQIWIPQDPGQSGKVQAKDFIMLLAGYDAHSELESGDKETRARPFSAQCEARNVKLLRGHWIDDYLHELTEFPTGRYKDQVDASSGAFGVHIMYPKQMTKVVGAKGGY